MSPDDDEVVDSLVEELGGEVEARKKKVDLSVGPGTRLMRRKAKEACKAAAAARKMQPELEEGEERLVLDIDGGDEYTALARNFLNSLPAMSLPDG